MGCQKRPVDCSQHIIGAIGRPGDYQPGDPVKKLIKITITILVAYLMSVAIDIVLAILVNDNLLKSLLYLLGEDLRPKIAGIPWHFR